jgi:hypothetical protein
LSLLLRVAAVFVLVWGVALVGFKDRVFGLEPLQPLARSLANGLGIAYIALALSFLYAAREPARHRDAIYSAIALMALRMGNDIYELLALVPPEYALVTLADLVVSTAMLVGLLEALPRTFAPPDSR